MIPVPSSAHNEALTGDVLYSAFLNYEWRQIVVPCVISGMEEIARSIDDEAERQAFEVLYGAMIDDFYNADTPLAEAYRQRVMATTPLRFNRMSEGAFSVLLDSAGNAYTGTYTGVTWDNNLSPFGEPTPIFDGVNDFANMYSSAFATALNPNEMTITLWLKMASGAWSDGAFRVPIVLLRDGNNFIRLLKASTNGQMTLDRSANGTNKGVNATGQSSYDWECWQASVSVGGGGLLGAGEMKLFKNGVQVGATSTGNLACAGSGLNSNGVVIGAGNGSPVLAHHGRIMNVILHNRAIDNDILALSSLT